MSADDGFAVLQDQATTSGAGKVLALDQRFGGATVFRIVEVGTGTINFEGSLGKNDWFPVECRNVADSTTVATTTTAVGTWRVDNTGLIALRARLSGVSSGPFTVWARSQN